jgi:hypothetical protein
LSALPLASSFIASSGAGPTSVDTPDAVEMLSTEPAIFLASASDILGALSSAAAPWLPNHEVNQEPIDCATVAMTLPASFCCAAAWLCCACFAASPPGTSPLTG